MYVILEVCDAVFALNGGRAAGTLVAHKPYLLRLSGARPCLDNSPENRADALAKRMA
jgi:hypothetical protein